jgi:tryptophanyl-tRNA synthetase
MLRPAIELATRHEAYVFVADAHAMTTVEDPGQLGLWTDQMAASVIALRLDPDRSVRYRQSDVPEVFELAWILACCTPKGLLNRAHAHMAAVDTNRLDGAARR